MVIYWLLLVTNFLLAVSDALYDNGNKKNSKVIEIGALMLLFYIGTINMYPLWLLFIVVVLIRFGVFNVTYNIFRNPRLPLTYIGTTDYVDKVISKIPKSLLPLYYIISLCIAFGLIFNY